MVRLHADANYESGEYAILLRSDLQGHGLGWRMMDWIIRYARAEGLHRIKGQVLRENVRMLKMCRELGFTVTPAASENDVLDVSLVPVLTMRKAARSALTHAVGDIVHCHNDDLDRAPGRHSTIASRLSGPPTDPGHGASP